jgi:hypothetical protein
MVARWSFVADGIAAEARTIGATTGGHVPTLEPRREELAIRGVRRFAEARGGEMTLSESTPGWYSHQPGRGLIEIISKEYSADRERPPAAGDPPLTIGLALNPINRTFDPMSAPLTISWIGSLEDGRSICL